MVLNIILAAIASACQFVNAFLGRKLAGKSLTPKEQRGYDALFISLGFVGIVLVAVIAYRGNRQERAHFVFDVKNTYETHLPNGTNAPYSWFVIDQPLSFLVWKTNSGSGSAYNVDMRARTILEADITLSSQQQAIDEFSNWLKTQTDLTKQTLGKGESNFVRADGNILSPEDYNNLISGRKIAYIVARVLFEDDFGSHTGEVCKLFVPQKEPPGSPIPEVTADCNKHIGEIR